MSTVEEKPYVNPFTSSENSSQFTNSPTKPLSQDLKSRTSKWLLPTYEIFLSVLHVSLTIVFATLGDALVILVISWAFGNPANQPMIAQTFLEGIRVLSIIGASASYAIYLTYSLIQDVQHVKKMIHEDKEERKNI
jgi:hypothetical protein